MAKLSAKTIAVLRLIADGQSYAQIVDGHPGLTYLDIFAAAEEALGLDDSPSAYEERLAEIRSRSPRAYEPWTSEEEAQLLALRAGGVSTAEIARRLERQPSAIQSRLAKLDTAPRT